MSLEKFCFVSYIPKFYTKVSESVGEIKYTSAKQSGIIHVVLGIGGVFNNLVNPTHWSGRVTKYIIYPQKD